MRILLRYVRGPTSFEGLNTVNGNGSPTCQDACRRLGLLKEDQHWVNPLSDAVISEPATKLRELFTIILIFCQPSDPFRNDNQDITLDYNDDISNEGLIIIEVKIHEICDKYLTDFGSGASFGETA